MPHGIYPHEDAAKFYASCAGSKYRPSNGTEGSIFIESWCGECGRDKDQDCPILASTFAFDVDDEEYPKEWQYGKDGQPKCTAWIALSDPIPRPRCEMTPDMFDGGSNG